MVAPVCVAQEGGVVGLNFHQSREVLITDSINGSAFTVSVRRQYGERSNDRYLQLF